MKKQFAAIFAATAVLGVTTAFAANPFSDVTPDSWAYQAVSQLASTGIITGYPDGTFRGENGITRFQVAQMVAKALANQDRANAEQQALINRLADEFSNELNNLGVRVARLEDRVGNVKVTGDMRLRYLGSQKKDGNYVNAVGDYSKGSQFDARARIQFNAKVNDRTDAVVRVTSGDFEFGDATNGGNATATIDRAYVNHKFGERVSVKAGRFNQMISNGLIYDDGFDGVQFNAGNHKLNFQAAYGYGIEGGFATDIYDPNFHGGPAYVTSYRGYRGWLATAHYALQDNVGVTGYYGFNNKTNKSIGDNDKLPNYYRVDLMYLF